MQKRKCLNLNAKNCCEGHCTGPCYPNICFHSILYYVIDLYNSYLGVIGMSIRTLYIEYVTNTHTLSFEESSKIIAELNSVKKVNWEEVMKNGNVENKDCSHNSPWV